MPLITETARAKINLTLRVLGKRPDGYHQIESLVAFADLGDAVSLDRDAVTGVQTSGRFAKEIEGANLAGKALHRLARAEPRLRLGQVRLEKRLPVAAGIGGGSADAAAVMRAVRRANPEFVALVSWQSIAAELGADVPVCLQNVPAFMRGIGELVEPIAQLPRLDCVLVNPLVPVPANKTAQVFKYLNAPLMGPERRETEQPVCRASNRSGLLNMMRRTGNDLQAAACEVIPDIVVVLSVLEKTPGAELVQMSGAGPTCFAVLGSADLASDAAVYLRAEHPQWWIEAAVIG